MEIEEKITLNFFKILSTACAGIIVCTGIVFASYTIYDKIWKEPTIITQEEENKRVEEINKPITNEEKQTLISEDQAIQIGKNILNILNYGNLDFEKVNIVRGNVEKENSDKYFILCTESNINKGITISINASNGEFCGFRDNTILSENLKCDDISEETAKEIANNLYDKLNILKKDDDYKIVSAKRQDIASGSEVHDMWYVTYAKTYNSNYDENSTFGVEFVVVDGKTNIFSISGKVESNFENNSIMLSKDEAIEIATKKEKSFSTLEISEISAELGIEKMNGFIYALENDIPLDTRYTIDDVTRNVWVVRIKHKKDHRARKSDLETVKNEYDKKYYVDTTTGEIIGGDQIEYFDD